MEDSSTNLFPIALKWSLGLERLKELKNKLVAYFQSKNKSGGGECVLMDMDCSHGYILIHFNQESVRDRVLQNQFHVLQLPNGEEIQLNVTLPEAINPKGDTGIVGEATADPKNRCTLQNQGSASTEEPSDVVNNTTQEVVIENIQERSTPEMLNLLLENVCDLTEGPDFHTEMIPERCLAVVTFKCHIGIPTFINSFSNHHRVKELNLTTKQLKETKSIRVENLPPNISKYHLVIYFESKKSGGGDVKEAELLQEEEAAVVTFCDRGVLKTVLKKQHVFEKKLLSVYPYHPSLGITLYGKNGPSLKMPTPVEHDMCPYILEFILRDEDIKSNIDKKMACQYCEIKWPELGYPNSVVKLCISNNKSTYVRTMAKIVRTWKANVSKEFSSFISVYRSVEYNVNKSVWEVIKKEVCNPLYAHILIKTVLDKEKVFLAGFSKDIAKVENIFQKLVENTSNEIERKNKSIATNVHLSPALYELMSRNDLGNTVLDVSSDISMSYDVSAKCIKLYGPKEDVLNAKCIILNMKQELKSKSIQIDTQIKEFLYFTDNDEMSRHLLLNHNIYAMFQIDCDTVTLTGLSIKDLSEAEKRIRKDLSFQCVSVQEKSIMQSAEWKNLTAYLHDTFNSETFTVLIEEDENQVVIAGLASAVKNTYKQLQDFLDKNAAVQKDIEMDSEAIMQFIKEERQMVLETIGKRVHFEIKGKTLSLSGPQQYVQEATTTIKDILSSLYSDTLVIKKPGAKKFCLTNEDMYAAKAKKDYKCVIHLQKEENHQLTTASTENLEAEFGDQNMKYTTDIEDNVKSYQNKNVSINLRTTNQNTLSPEGLSIKLIQQTIEDCTTDVIVNSVGLKAHLNSNGVSKALYHRAGPRLQSLLNEQILGKQVCEGCIFKTDACHLNCRTVLHVVTPDWDHGMGFSEKILRDIINECLTLTEQIQLASISFPAIGTGFKKFPKALVAAIMFEEVLEFRRINNPANIQEVYFVCNPNDAEMIKAFSDEQAKHQGVNVTNEGNPKSTSANHSSFFGIVTTTALGVHEMKIGSVTFQVKTGDITKEDSDVIVNSSNGDFTLQQGVSKAILQAAGENVVLECILNGTNPHQGYIITSSGNLSCKHLLHVVGPTNPADIKTIVLNALNACEKLQVTSVAFPAIGTGAGGIPPAVVADATIDAIIDFAKTKSVQSIKTVKVIIFQQQMLNNFFMSMKQKEVNTQIKKKKKINSFISWIKPQKKSRSSKLSAFQLMANIEPAIIYMCGESRGNVKLTFTWLQKLILDEQTNIPISDELISEFEEEELQTLHNLQKTFQVFIEYTPHDSSIQIHGLTRDVLDVYKNIQDLINKKRDKTVQEQEANLCSNLVEWRYEDGANFIPFDKITNLKLEEAAGTQKINVDVLIKGSKYTVNIQQKLAKDNRGHTVKIEQIYKHEEISMKLPTHWNPMNNQFEVVTLNPGSQEYNDVKHHFLLTFLMKIMKIERIQNQFLWQNYQIKKQSMDNKNGNTNNEKQLFHGTDPNTVKQVNQNGFNRSFAGKNAAAYGNGTYFAVQASYSANDTYSRPDSTGHKYMYLARVLTGESCAGSNKMVSPPPKNASDPTDLYDSSSDNPSHPSIYVIFHDIQAYPEYLITFIK
ncbi:protein mono-ADP-ribosyltransferase PARP14-like [Bombina bombina]|uniref:protein mono-ADP-ribosyltransferase PARP14-like n=1 Tax=Bombina bombina TaxID=8345 RepID=UPI00235AE113|nr:protein mono-ADP-ribosyltransferase PARP14-like [Bombina bombina]